MPGPERRHPDALEGESLEEVARSIFGSSDTDSIRRWVSYWEDGPRRSRELLESLEPLVPLDFEGRRVLDIGCGAGGLGELIGDQCRLYAGGDYHFHVLKFSRRAGNTAPVQCSGTDLPFPDATFDYVFAMDVIEHLVGGEPWQIRFLREVRRVLRSTGMIFLSTPNRWYPYEGHTRLYGPQYLPLSLSDLYISWRNPGFLKEHNTFREIKILGPRRLSRILRASRLSFLHDLPCALDRGEFLKHFPLRGPLAYLGLGWWLHAEFWGILVHEEMRERLRVKLRKHWFYEQNQPSPRRVRDFAARIDFEEGYFNPQLGPGWYWHERDRRAYRWAGPRATCYLEKGAGPRYLRVHGFSPRDNVLDVYAEGVRIGERRLESGKDFRLEYLVPFEPGSETLLEVELRSRTTLRPEAADDRRELGVMVFSIGLFDRLSKEPET